MCCAYQAQVPIRQWSLQVFAAVDSTETGHQTLSAYFCSSYVVRAPTRQGRAPVIPLLPRSPSRSQQLRGAEAAARPTLKSLQQGLLPSHGPRLLLPQRCQGLLLTDTLRLRQHCRPASPAAATHHPLLPVLLLLLPRALLLRLPLLPLPPLPLPRLFRAPHWRPPPAPWRQPASCHVRCCACAAVRACAAVHVYVLSVCALYIYCALHPTHASRGLSGPSSPVATRAFTLCCIAAISFASRRLTSLCPYTSRLYKYCRERGGGEGHGLGSGRGWIGGHGEATGRECGWTKALAELFGFDCCGRATCGTSLRPFRTAGGA